MRKPLRKASFFEQGLSFDLEELEFNEFVVSGKTAEVGEDLSGLGLSVVMDQPTRGEGHPDHPNEENKSGSKLEADRYQPSSIGLGVDVSATDIVAATTLVSLGLGIPQEKRTN